jgi:hypothetical protein
MTIGIGLERSMATIFCSGNWITTAGLNESIQTSRALPRGTNYGMAQPTFNQGRFERSNPKMAQAEQTQ